MVRCTGFHGVSHKPGGVLRAVAHDQTRRGRGFRASIVRNSRYLQAHEDSGGEGGRLPDRAAQPVDLGCVRRPRGAAQRRLGRLLVHVVPPVARAARPGGTRGTAPGGGGRRTDPAVEGAPGAGREIACRSGFRRRRRRRVGPVRDGGRAAEHPPPQGLGEGPDRPAGLPDHLLVRRPPLPQKGSCGGSRARGPGTDRRRGRWTRRVLSARPPTGQEVVGLVPLQRDSQHVRTTRLRLPATQGRR